MDKGGGSSGGSKNQTVTEHPRPPTAGITEYFIVADIVNSDFLTPITI